MYLAHSINNFNIKNIFLLLTVVSFLIFMALTIKNYPGHISVYIIFTLVSHGLLFLGFYKKLNICVCLFSTISIVYNYSKWPLNLDESLTFPYVEKGSNYLIEEFPDEKNYNETKDKIEEL